MKKMSKLENFTLLNKSQQKTINGGTRHSLPDCSAACNGIIAIDFLTGDCYCVTD